MNARWFYAITVALLLVVSVVGCSLGAPAATPTPLPTYTPLPTFTPVPTKTPVLTATPVYIDSPFVKILEDNGFTRHFMGDCSTDSGGKKPCNIYNGNSDNILVRLYSDGWVNFDILTDSSVSVAGLKTQSKLVNLLVATMWDNSMKSDIAGLITLASNMAGLSIASNSGTHKISAMKNPIAGAYHIEVGPPGSYNPPTPTP